MTNSEAVIDLQFLARRFEELDQLTYSINRESLDLSILALEEIDKLKAENEQYKSALTTWNNANNEMLKFNQELKDKIEQLKSELEQLKGEK